MAFPEWSRGAPGPDFEHGDNYSALEVVWSEKATGLVVLETRDGYVHTAPSLDVALYRRQHPETFSERQGIDDIEARIRASVTAFGNPPAVDAGAMFGADAVLGDLGRAPSRRSRVAAPFVRFAAGFVVGFGGAALVHWSPWH